MLPRGSLRCGPDCVGPTGTHESQRIRNSTWATRVELSMRRNSASQVPVLQSSGAVAQISPSPGSSNNPHPATGLPLETVSRAVADDEFGDFVGIASTFHDTPDDDEFGDFVQA